MNPPRARRLRATLFEVLSLAVLFAFTPARRSAAQTTDASRSEGVQTIKVRVRRVVVDVTVTDPNGKPVSGLTGGDFKVYEDGVAQDLRNFEVHTAEAQLPLPAPKLPKNTFSNISAAPQSSATTVILYDLLNTPPDAQPYAHEQLLGFLKEHKASGQVAIFVLTDKLHMLQGFTDDDNKLIAALNFQSAKGYKSSSLQSTSQASQQSDLLADTTGNPAAATQAGQTDASFQNISNMLKNLQADEASYLLDQRVDLTAQALQEIARFLIGLPGRKNLIWLSGSFPSGIVPDAGVDGRDPQQGHEQTSNTRNYSAVIVQATDLLNLSHVAVYPVDVRGLHPPSVFNAQSAGGPQLGGGSHQAEFQTETAEHATMDTIGDNTGGRAFYNTNGLKEAVAAAVEEGSLYYTLSYAPTNKAYDGKVRKVRVVLKEPGYRLEYRRTYFADDLDQLAHDQQEAPTDALAVSLEHGAPAARELFFEAHVVPAGQPVQATPGQMAQLMQYEAMETKNKKKMAKELETPVLLQPYVIQFVLLPRQIDMRMGADEARRDNLEVAAVSYNDDGLTLNGTRTQIQDVIRPERWAFMQESGYHIPMSFLAPVQARSMRLAVRDLSSGRLGSIEIPLPLPPEPNATLVPADAVHADPAHPAPPPTK
jgi:VWFA-related protein